MATLHYARHGHIAQTLTQIPTPYPCIGQESEFVLISYSGIVFIICLAHVFFVADC